MHLKKIILSVLAVGVIVSGAFIVKIYVLNPKPTIGSLQIYSFPKAKIFLNNSEIGQTPFTVEKVVPGEYQIKLVAQKAGNQELVWENRVRVLSGVLTYISREMGLTNETSAGQILTQVKLPQNKNCELSVISDPSETIVSIDGLEKGITSVLIKDLSCGDKMIVVSKPGYANQNISARLVPGFLLNAVVKLQKINSPITTEIKPAIEPVASQSAKVSETPTGFLRVRSASSSSALEIGRVTSGQDVSVLEKGTDWVKIKLDTLEGWVSVNYLVILEATP